VFVSRRRGARGAPRSIIALALRARRSRGVPGGRAGGRCPAQARAAAPRSRRPPWRSRGPMDLAAARSAPRGHDGFRCDFTSSPHIAGRASSRARRARG
jgi:hypothetical protein